ncbi:MAG: 16S rRNA (cytosine(1402)-N(4))-methyltransferase RsmH [Candidatus Paceibacterota bacterium]|jgi:16S rRNA (cytosine1402-N4)-methyltransferase
MSEVKKSVHKSVLLKEIIDGLNLSENQRNNIIILDATYGGGGHSREILKRYKQTRIIAIDQDNSVWQKNIERVSFYNKNFRNLDEVLQKEKITEVNGVIMDLGLSSDQLNPEGNEKGSGRGFSFMKDEPLIMTMKENPSSEEVIAEDVVNTWSEDSLAKIIAGYGEEKFAKRIARGIVKEREVKPLKTTHDLLSAIEKSVPASYRHGKTHFATRTFQAIRIAVNDELRALEEALPKAFNALRKGGRMSVISFHSLEDRIVKRFFREKGKSGEGKIINKKPIIPNEDEVKENKKARSAKLRIIEKL